MELYSYIHWIFKRNEWTENILEWEEKQRNAEKEDNREHELKSWKKSPNEVKGNTKDVKKWLLMPGDKANCDNHDVMSTKTNEKQSYFDINHDKYVHLDSAGNQSVYNIYC